jgi:hypothetical protein
MGTAAQAHGEPSSAPNAHVPLPWRTRLASRLHPDAWAVLALLAIVLLANLPYLARITDPNPLGPRSGLGVSSPGVIRGANTLDPTDGYITQALGHLAATDVLHGHLPLWNQYEGAGMPLLGEGQSAALFPPTLLLALSNGQFWEDLLLEVIAALGTYLVLRRLGCGRLTSIAGGAAFGVSGAYAWLATTAFNPIAFLTWAVLGLEQAHAASAARRRGGWWLISAALALSLYAGFPETAYIDGLVIAVWFLWRCGSGARPDRLGFVSKVAAGTLGALLLAAPFLVAFAEALPHEYVGFHNGHANALVMPPFAFPQLLLPYVYGPPLAFSDQSGALALIWGYAGGFVSIAAAFLALLSLLAPGRRGLKLILAAFVVLALSTIYGDPPVLRSILPALPGGTSVAFYRYSFGAVTFALLVLAALGIESVLAGQLRRGRAAGATGAALGLVALLAYEAHSLVTGLNGGASHSRWAWAQIGWGAAVVLAIGACAVGRGRIARYALVLILALDAGVMFAVHELPAPTAVRLNRQPVRYLQAHLGDQRFFTLGPLAPNYGGYFELASLNDIDLPLPSRWTRYVQANLDNYVNPVFFVGNDGGGRSLTVPTPAAELLHHLSSYRAAGVKYLLTPPGVRLPGSHDALVLVRRTTVAWIYRVSGAAPYLSGGPGCVLEARGRQAVRSSCSHSYRLVRRELFFPGWSATIDGRRAAIHPDGIFQSVTVPAGEHRVSFSYLPPQFELSLVGFVLGALWVTGGVAAARRRPRRAASSPASVSA